MVVDIATSFLVIQFESNVMKNFKGKVMKKEMLKMMMKKYNCQELKVVDKINPQDAGALSNGEFRIVFDVQSEIFNIDKKRVLLIEDVITKDNIHLYYEFMSKEELVINGIVINDEILDEAGYSYRTIYDFIEDNLKEWIKEATGSDLYMMEEDLEYLESLKDSTYTLSSLSTNHYITKEYDLEEFESICKELLELTNQ